MPPTDIVGILWDSSSGDKFNVLGLGSVYGKIASLVLGCEDGVIRVCKLPVNSNQNSKFLLKEECKFETKGGPIQALVINDLARFGSQDVAAADSRGMVTVFCNGQIIQRKSVSDKCIKSMQVSQDAAGNIITTTSDKDGHIASFTAYQDLWQLRIADTFHLKGVNISPSIHCLLNVNLCNAKGQTTDYVLAADNCKHLYFINQGTVVMVLSTPAPIITMCAGRFIENSQMESSDMSGLMLKDLPVQVALGTKSGAIYIMNNYEVYYEEIVNIQLPMREMKTLPSNDPMKTDAILCAGDFNALCVVKNGKMVAKHATPAWINTIITRDENNQEDNVIIGCQDGTIQGLQIQAKS